VPVCANAVGGKVLISMGILGKLLGEKHQRWGKFFKITADSAPLPKSFVDQIWIRKL
jgi:hypothetical protein